MSCDLFLTEIRRSNFKLKKTHYQYNQRKSNVLNKIYGNQNEIGVTRHKIPIENLCPEATPSSLTGENHFSTYII